MLASGRWLMGSARWRLIGIFLLVALSLLSLLAINWNAELTTADEPPRLIVKYQGTELTDGTVARVTETGSDSSVILTLELSERPTPATGKLARFGDDPAITVYPWPAGVLLANLDFVHPPDIDITPYHTPARLTTFQFNTTNWSAPQRLKLTSGATSPSSYGLHGELLASGNFHGVKFPAIEVEVVAGNSLGSLSPVTLPSTPAPTPTATPTPTPTPTPAPTPTPTPTSTPRPGILIHGDKEIQEGDSASFLISVSPPPTLDITVSVSTKDGTATAGSDYVAVTNKQVTIPAGQTSATVTVDTTFDETHPESNEQFTVELSGVTVGDYVITEDTATVTIVSVACVDSVRLGDLQIALPEEFVYTSGNTRELRLFKDGSRGFDVSLNRKPCDPVSLKILATHSKGWRGWFDSEEVSYSVDGTTFSNPLTLSFDGSNWNTAQIVTLQHRAKGSSWYPQFSTHVQLTATDKTTATSQFNGYIVRWGGTTTHYSWDKVTWHQGLEIRGREEDVHAGKEISYWVRLNYEPKLPITLDVFASVRNYSTQPYRYTYYHVAANEWYLREPPKFKFDPYPLTFTPENWRVPQQVKLIILPDNDDDSNVIEFDYKVRERPDAIVLGFARLRLADKATYMVVTNPDRHGDIAATEGGAAGTMSMKMKKDPGTDIKVTVTNPEPTKLSLSATTFTFTAGDSGNWNTDQTLSVSAPADSVTEDETIVLTFIVTKTDGTDLGMTPFKRYVKVTNVD